MDERPGDRFLPRPPEGWTGFAGGTDPNGVPSVPADVPWGYRMATPAPLCPHGTAYAQPCYSCGWTCPACKRSYAPWVRECNYRHEDGWREHMGVVPGTELPIPPAPADEFARLKLNLPYEMASDPHYERNCRIGPDWLEVLPGLQCRSGGINPEGTYIQLRLTPVPGSDDPA